MSGEKVAAVEKLTKGSLASRYAMKEQIDLQKVRQLKKSYAIRFLFSRRQQCIYLASLHLSLVLTVQHSLPLSPFLPKKTKGQNKFVLRFSEKRRKLHFLHLLLPSFLEQLLGQFPVAVEDAVDALLVLFELVALLFQFLNSEKKSG